MKKKLTYILSVIAIALGALAVHPVVAQEDEIESGQGLEISPPLITLEADPGETVVIEISLRNITEMDVVTRGEVNDFVARGETGEPRILFDEGEESPYPLASYISNVPGLEIAPSEQEVVRIPINIPDNASPGAHMGVVRFSAESAGTDPEESQVALTASIGTLVLLNVSGDAEVSVDVEELAVAQAGEQGGFFEAGPLTFMTRLNNRGNVFVQPRGELRVSNIFGSDVALTPLENEEVGQDDEEAVEALAFNSTDRNVLPDSIRRFEQAVDKPFWFGRYTLTADLVYGPDDTTLEESVTFWVIPYKWVAVVLLLLITIDFFGRKTLRAYKRNIIEQARRSESQRS